MENEWKTKNEQESVAPWPEDRGGRKSRDRDTMHFDWESTNRIIMHFFSFFLKKKENLFQFFHLNKISLKWNIILQN